MFNLLADDLTPDTSHLLATIGVPGLVFIVLVLCGVIIYLNKRGEKANNDLLAEKNAHLQSVTELAEKYGSTSEKQIFLMQQVYDAIVSRSRRS